MSDRETAALIGLLRHGDRPWHHYAEMSEAAGSSLAVLEGRAVEASDGMSEQLFETPEDRPEVDVEAIVCEIEEWRAEGIRVVSILDDDYPLNLRTIHNRPPILFLRGQLTEDDGSSVAVVGTRQASEAGLEAAREMAQGIAREGYTVVSGLALGVDTAAHTGALDLGARTVAVIGTGLRRAYPAENAELQERIATEAAVVSQFFPDAPPTRQSFPMRNAVMSGLALATVVIEASHTSGAKMQARLALEHNRPVFLHERLLSHPWARDYAARPGTHVITRADEVLEQIERLNRPDLSLSA